MICANGLDRPTVLILGSGRSGTTWLTEMLGQPFRYRVLFEPFTAHRVPGAECIADRYYDPVCIPSEVASFCRKALNDEIDSDWIGQVSNRRFRMHRWRFWPKVRICKDVRSNLFVPAYRTIFGPDLPIVVLIRHPVAVVESFLRVRFPWAFDLSNFFSQQALQVNGIPLDRFRQYADSDVGKLGIRWVAENSHLLRHGADLGARVVFYEDLRADPVEGITALATDLGLVCASDLDKIVGRLSYTTHRRSPLRQNGKHDSTERLSPEAMMTLGAILDAAGVEYPRDNA